MPEIKGRRSGSVIIAIVTSVFSLFLAIFEFIAALTLHDHFEHISEYLINSVCCLVFSAIIAFWVISPHEVAHQDSLWRPRKGYGNNGQKPWSGLPAGIGNETIMMVLTVVTAIVVIFTLTDSYSKKHDAISNNQTLPYNL